jgi:hypothetical protein
MVAEEKGNEFYENDKKGDKENSVGTFFLNCYKFCVHNFLKIGRGGKKTPCRWFF